MLATLHPPWRVAKPGRDSPQRHKLPAPLRQAVIARCRSLALGATPANTAMRLHHDFDQLRLALVTMHSHLFVHEAHKPLHPIQDGLNRNFLFDLNNGTIVHPSRWFATL